jgi:hypothetical protein
MPFVNSNASVRRLGKFHVSLVGLTEKGSLDLPVTPRLVFSACFGIAIQLNMWDQEPITDVLF